jgi:cyclophilin family peptidyl-prolyl cis-trans isomerase
LFAAPGAEAEARASVMAGRVDLAGMFPVLMDSERAKVRYVQLFVGERAVGAPVVVQPVVAPMKALPTDGRGLGVRFARSGPAYFGGVRMYVLNDVELTTSLGAIRLRLRPDAAPNTAWHFRTLVDQGFYDGTTFHRVVGPSDGATPDSPAGQGYLIQGGDPVGSGVGGPGVAIDLEQSTLAHDFGVVSLARLAEPDSGGSQFFICLSRGMARSLDGAYAAFAEVIEGAEVVRAIGRVKVGDMDRPIKPVVIERARLVEAGAMGGAAKSAGDGRSADRPETPGER